MSFLKVKTIFHSLHHPQFLLHQNFWIRLYWEPRETISNTTSLSNSASQGTWTWTKINMSLSYTQLYFPSNNPEISFKHFSFYSLGLNFLRAQRWLNSLFVTNPHQYPPNALLPSQRVSPTCAFYTPGQHPPPTSTPTQSLHAPSVCHSSGILHFTCSPSFFNTPLMILSPLL